MSYQGMGMDLLEQFGESLSRLGQSLQMAQAGGVQDLVSGHVASGLDAA